MNEKLYADNEILDPSEEYWREKDPDEEDDSCCFYEQSKPPHY